MKEKCLHCGEPLGVFRVNVKGGGVHKECEPPYFNEQPEKKKSFGQTVVCAIAMMIAFQVGVYFGGALLGFIAGLAGWYGAAKLLEDSDDDNESSDV